MKTNMLVLMLPPLALTGCAAVGNNCVTTSSTTITPLTATLDHSAAPPANQVQFTAITKTTYQGQCVISNVIPSPYQRQWVSSDTIDAPIDSTFGESTNGIAVCKNSTTVPVTMSVVGVDVTAKLSCN